MMQQWFQDAKLGIFLHWGIYAVNGITESWSFYNGQISYEDYMRQCEGFTADHYDPAAWADLFRRAGARYAVLTTKHHDGVALWDTQLSDLSVVKKTPAARDLIAPYCQAMRAAGLHVGLYFSHLDWSHPDNSAVSYSGTKVVQPTDANFNKYVHSGKPDDPAAWERFLQFHRGQLRELMTSFGPVDLLWFDGVWEKHASQWRMNELREFLHGFNPAVILNDRMCGHGDYQTPEQGMPVVAPAGPWEFCTTLNDSWGYQPQDRNHKSVRKIVRTFAECIGMGGNLLLDVGPRADGTIDPEQEKRLLGLGDWIRKHEEAVYPTTAGLPAGHFLGSSTLSRDRKSLYLILFDRPWEDIAVKGIRNKINRVTVLGSGMQLTHRIVGGFLDHVPGIVWIDIPEAELDSSATVIKVELEGELSLYRESGEAITKN